ncbi:MAG: hypothetical protein VXZ72_00325 [Chlamydiota bacterium]|nr:hypothetical protein [Chlamydiota bacterium]
MAFLQRNGADDLLFPSSESGQTRYNQMRVIMFSGAHAAQRMAEFIRSYKNRDGSVGLPMTHIGATSPYIDGGNLFYIYFQDNANDPHLAADFPATDAAGNQITLAAAELLRAGAIADNKILIARLQGSDAGWRTN